MNDTPQLPGIPVEDRTLVKVWCKFCKRFHTHGGYGHKVAHCQSKNGYQAYEVVKPLQPEGA